jgi:hypothetical protein
MTIEFRPAKRENIATLVSLAGGTGSGKTLSAMLLAKGLAGGKRFAVIDTEAGRAKHYADQFEFDHCDLRPPFRPDTYADAVAAADEAGYPVIVVDSGSHVWAGDGGCVGWHDEILDDMVARKRDLCDSKGWQFDEYKTRNASTVSAWIEPKTAHKRMVSRLLQVRAHVILCLRAEEKIEIVKVDNDGTVLPPDAKGGKTVVRPKESAAGRDGWIPVCEKNLPYEVLASFLLTRDDPGVPKAIKLPGQIKHLFPDDRPITADAGAGLAAWAGGARAPAKARSFADRIWDAATMAELRGIAAEISDAKERRAITQAEHRVAHDAYKQRSGELAAAEMAEVVDAPEAQDGAA